MTNETLNLISKADGMKVSKNEGKCQADTSTAERLDFPSTQRKGLIYLHQRTHAGTRTQTSRHMYRKLSLDHRNHAQRCSTATCFGHPSYPHIRPKMPAPFQLGAAVCIRQPRRSQSGIVRLGVFTSPNNCEGGDVLERWDQTKWSCWVLASRHS
jgi:hypothetical protein